jgi:membrane peptidoglycan carboxypeptidase
MPGSAPRRIGTAFSAFLGMIAVAVIAGVMVAVAVTPAIALTGTTAKNGIGLFEDLPADLKIAPLDQKTKIYAKSGGKDVLLASFYTQDREVVPMTDITTTVKNATLAAEDVRFYSHGGVDPAGIVRATVADLLGKNVQGASTITQQYVKNVCVQEAEQLHTTAAVDKAYNVCVDPSVGRKLREARLAIALEKKYSKDQILLGYLNIAPFGGRVYGIQSAAQYYYGVDANKLSVAQAASLLAMVNNPNVLRIDEKANIAPNTTRRNYILANELSHKLITDVQYQAAMNTPVKPKITQPKTGCQSAGIAGYFCDYVVNTVLNSSAFGKDYDTRYANLQSAGWKIYTTLNLDLQKKAQSVMNTYIPKSSSVFNVGSSAISVEVGTGRIITMVQNKNYNNSAGADNTAVNFNTDYAYGGSSGIQPGSTYKLFTLLDWLKTGHTLDAEVNSDQRTIPASDFTQCGKPDYGDGPWPVGNDEGTAENGLHSVTSATALSINGAFATMGQQLDLCDIRKTAESFDVHPAKGGQLEDNPSSIIGTNYVAPLSMATAYAGIANNGKTCTPIAIDKVVKADGSSLAVPKTSCRQSVDPQVAIAAAYALRAVMTGGTASADNTPDGLYEFGKTGTTDGNANTWMIGTTSKVTTAVWVGNISGSQDLRATNLGYCPAGYSSQAAVQRHCLWKGIQTAVNKVYGGATSWPQPEPQYLYGGSSYAAPNAATTTGTVPNVQGMSKSAAEAALVSAGYAWAIGGAVSSSLPAGEIASTSPAIGSSAPQHTEVTIYPSSG